jgi:hypothetical protein
MEGFDRCKLRSALARALHDAPEGFYRADALASAIHYYLTRHSRPCISSAAIFEMALSCLRGLKLAFGARRMEQARQAKATLRGRLVLHHGFGPATSWSKEWLVHHAVQELDVGMPVARILAGEIEQKLIRRRRRQIGRGAVLRMLHREAEAVGLTVQSSPADQTQTA